MGIDGGQKKVGTNFIRESNSSDKGTPFNDPLAGGGKNSKTSTHTDFRRENVKGDQGGKEIEGQKLRGYVFDSAKSNIGAVDDATVAPDGTNRVKKLG